MNPYRFFVLAVMRPVRLLLLLLWIALGLLLLALVYARLGLMQQGRLASFWSHGLLRVMGVRLRVQGSLPESGALMVANHVSWLDPFLLIAICPVRFVAKDEIRSWPVFGWLAVRAGTVFIRRDQQRDITRVAKRFSGLLNDGMGVALFPESTTGDGSHIMPFKTGLFEVAVSQTANCVPVALRYGHSAAIWIDDMSFVESIWRILGQVGIDANVQLCPVIPAAAGLNRRELARSSECAIASALSLPIRRTRSETPADLPV